MLVAKKGKNRVVYKKNDKFEITVIKDNEPIFLGYYNGPKEAEKVFISEQKKLFGRIIKRV